jgi:hypothetical protein
MGVVLPRGGAPVYHQPHRLKARAFVSRGEVTHEDLHQTRFEEARHPEASHLQQPLIHPRLLTAVNGASFRSEAALTFDLSEHSLRSLARLPGVGPGWAT